MTVLDEMLSAKAWLDDVAEYVQALSPSDFCTEAGKSLLFSRAVSLDFCLAAGDGWWSWRSRGQNGYSRRPRLISIPFQRVS